ncbi:MAG: hypothetical protein KGM24_05500 [Elusimicrobia bacterium]|nr:hypothetical protein [Elusimicrobiota bacterium]
MTQTLADELVIENPQTETLPEEKPEEEVDLRRLSQRKPPSRGLCRRCGENKPINRLMLCYPCWVKSELERKGWRDGQPHPDDCGCEIGAGHGRLSEGN